MLFSSPLAKLQMLYHFRQTPPAAVLIALTLKHVGPALIQYLTFLFNLSLRNANLQFVCKFTVIYLISKPDKPVSARVSLKNFRTIPFK